MIIYNTTANLFYYYRLILLGRLGTLAGEVSALYISAGAVNIATLIFGYVFLGIGLFAMARRRRMAEAYLAFVPFGQVFLMGRLIGDARLFGISVKWLGLAAMIAQIVSAGLKIYLDIATLPFIREIWGQGFSEEGLAEIFGVDMLGNTVGVGVYSTYLYGVQPVRVIAGLLEFPSFILMLALVFLLYRCYAPRTAFIFAFLYFVTRLSLPIVVFIIRNNSSDEYRDFMKMKMHSMYGGGNPYQYDDGSYRDPYDLSGNGKPKETPPESPFGEYDGKK